MIDEDRTMQLYGYCSTDLSLKSNKPIVRVCEECGNYKVVSKSNYIISDGIYRSLCQLCACQTKEFRKKRSETMIDYMKDHNIRDDLSQSLKQFHIDNPEFKTENGERIKQAYMNNPELHIKACESQQQSHINDPTRGKRQGETLKQRYIDDLALRYRMGEAQKQKFIDDPTLKGRISESLKQKHINDHTAGERHSAFMQGQNYDAGEWMGYTDKSRPHLVPESQCIYLNSEFEGCNRHHIMSGVIICIPKDMHNKLYHALPFGKRKSQNMNEINELALKYLMVGM